MNEFITITREGTKVKVTLDEGPLDYRFFFTHDCGNDLYAELLRRHFSDKLQSIVAYIRKEEYNKGYEDGRGKKAKKQYFYGCLKRVFSTGS